LSQWRLVSQLIYVLGEDKTILKKTKNRLCGFLFISYL
jgi:hypothetical protein